MTHKDTNTEGQIWAKSRLLIPILMHFAVETTVLNKLVTWKYKQLSFLYFFEL